MTYADDSIADEPKQSRYRQRIDRLKAVRPRSFSKTEIIVGYSLLGGTVALLVYVGLAVSDGVALNGQLALVIAATGIVIGLFLGAVGASIGPMKWILAAIWLVLELFASLIYVVLASLAEIASAFAAALLSGC
jgi:hypothetical protein